MTIAFSQNPSTVKRKNPSQLVGFLPQPGRQQNFHNHLARAVKLQVRSNYRQQHCVRRSQYSFPDTHRIVDNIAQWINL